MNVDERIASCERRMKRDLAIAERARARAAHWAERIRELKMRKTKMSARDLEYYTLMYGTGPRQITHTTREAVGLLMDYHRADPMTLAHICTVSHSTIYNMLHEHCSSSATTLAKLGLERTDSSRATSSCATRRTSLPDLTALLGAIAEIPVTLQADLETGCTI
jgi:hypothetical protein